MSIEDRIISVVDSARSSVVGIVTPRGVVIDEWLNAIPMRGFGTGFLVSNDVVVTANHVVQNLESVEVMSPGGDVTVGEVVGADPEYDVALVRARGLSGARPIVLGDSDKLRVGEVVLAMGYPLGLLDQPTVTMGVISAVGRTISTPVGVMEGLIQTDAAINPGNSGGPLINLRGEVVGMNTAIVMGAQGIGFAVPINLVKLVIEEITRFGRVIKPRLGIYGTEISRSLSRYYRLGTDKGILVVKVLPGSPADDVGIRQGDVIIAIDDVELGSVTQLKIYVTKKYIEGVREFNLTLMRGRTRYRLRVELP